ncbi:hypothetical protein BGX38DRAFT_1265544 [Terfezia claveryi]|nr:hypothetical protein BGX38DRAFT_1265544 [Terfezia claveryi]
MAQLASQQPQEQRLSQTPMPTQPPVTGTPLETQGKIEKATLLAFRDIIDNAEKSRKEGSPQPVAGLNYNQLRTGALQLLQKGREQQVKPAQGQAIPAGKAPINSPQIQTVGPQKVTGVQHAIAAQAPNTSQHTQMAQVHPSAITSNIPIVKALAMVNGLGPTIVAKSTISTPALAPTATQTIPTIMAMESQPKTVATPVSAAQPQALPDAKPATAPAPKATSQQLLNILARLKAQKLAQQLAQGQVGQKAQGTTGASIGSLASPVSPSPVPQTKRPIDQISTVAGSEIETVTSDTVTEAHVARKLMVEKGSKLR